MSCNEFFKDCIIRSMRDSVYKIDGCADNILDELDDSYRFLVPEFEEIQRNILKLHHLIDSIESDFECKKVDY